MTFTEFIYWLGDVFLKIFDFMEKLGGIPNVLIIICITIATCVWVWRMSIYNKEAHRNGTLK